MMLRLQTLSVLALAALIASTTPACAPLFNRTRAPCAWLEIESMPGLVVTAPRRIDPDYHDARCGGTAGSYVLQRDSYTIELWNGRSLGSALYVRAVSREGRRLTVKGADFAPIHPTVGTLEREYDQLLDLRGLASGRGRVLILPATVKFVVLTSDGSQLGAESLTIVEKRGTYPRIS